MSDNKDRTLFCGNLHEKVTEDILYEFFLQAGPLESVTIPKDKDGRPKKFAFITFKHSVSVPYTVALMNGTSLYGRPLTLDARTGAESGHNPYLEKLMQYQNMQQQQQMHGRNYNLDQRDTYDDNSRRGYDSKRYETRNEPPQRWNQFPSASTPNYGMNSPHMYRPPIPNQGRYVQNSMTHVGYPPQQYGNPWSRNHR